MKPLTYNSPERAKERAEVVPPSIEDISFIIQIMNTFVPEELEETRGEIQRLIDHYENLKHFHSVANGWQGLNELQVNYEIVKH